MPPSREYSLTFQELTRHPSSCQSQKRLNVMVADIEISPIETANPASNSRVKIFWIVGIGLSASYIALRGTGWHGSAHLHTIMEVIATTLALFVGVMAMVRFYTLKNSTLVFVGTGFLGAALLDGYHALVTSAFFAPYLPSDLPSLIPWSWIASRQFLALMLCFGSVAWALEKRRGGDGRINEKMIYLFSTVLTIASFVFFAFVPLPRAYYPELFFHRPEEFAPALFFGIALCGHLKYGDWRQGGFEYWLVLALIVSLVGQVVFMSFSGSLFDLEFDAAHLLKKVSYVCVLTGLMTSMFKIFRQAATDRDLLALEVKRAEIDVVKSERLLHAVIESIADAIITIDRKGNIQSFNFSAEKIFGYSEETVIGRNVKMLMPEEVSHDHDSYLTEYGGGAASTIINERRDLAGLRRDGTTFPLELCVTEMNIAGQRMFTGIIRDITHIKEAEEKVIRANEELLRYARNAEEDAKNLARSNHDLEQFASVAAHDLQEPLRKVQAFGDRLESNYSDALGDQGRDYVNRMQNAASRMQTLIGDLLAFSRVSSTASDFVPVDLDQLTQEVLSDLEIRIEETDAQISVSGMPKIDGDALQLRQLIQNLIGNSLKYSREGIAPSIELSGRMLSDGPDKPQQHCEISITDNGIGFDEEYAEKIFGIFQRLHGRTQYEGTGVGLAICRKIAERHGGTITASGGANQGAKFIVVLPMKHPDGGSEV